MVSGKSVKKAIKMTVKDQKLNFNSSVIRGSNVQQYSLKCLAPQIVSSFMRDTVLEEILYPHWK